MAQARQAHARGTCKARVSHEASATRASPVSSPPIVRGARPIWPCRASVNRKEWPRERGYSVAKKYGWCRVPGTKKNPRSLDE